LNYIPEVGVALAPCRACRPGNTHPSSGYHKGLQPVVKTAAVPVPSV